MMELIGFALSMVGMGLMLFALGAVMGFSWGVGSLELRPPRWIAGIAVVAGIAFVAASALRGDWLSAALVGVLFATVVGGLLRIGPWRRRSGGGQPS